MKSFQTILINSNDPLQALGDCGKEKLSFNSTNLNSCSCLTVAQSFYSSRAVLALKVMRYIPSVGSAVKLWTSLMSALNQRTQSAHGWPRPCPVRCSHSQTDSLWQAGVSEGSIPKTLRLGHSALGDLRELRDSAERRKSYETHCRWLFHYLIFFKM